MDGIADAPDLNDEAVRRFLDECPGEAGDHEPPRAAHTKLLLFVSSMVTPLEL